MQLSFLISENSGKENQTYDLNARREGDYFSALAVHPDFFLYTVTLASAIGILRDLYCGKGGLAV